MGGIIMSGFVSKQPNGKYCRFSTTTDCLSHINMTFDDYTNVVMQMQHLNETAAQKEAKEVFTYYLRPFDDVLSSFSPENISEKSLVETVRKMCDPNGTYEELEYEIIEKIEYEDDEEFDKASQSLEEKAREISGIGYRHK